MRNRIHAAAGCHHPDGRQTVAGAAAHTTPNDAMPSGWQQPVDGRDG